MHRTECPRFSGADDEDVPTDSWSDVARGLGGWPKGGPSGFRVWEDGVDENHSAEIKNLRDFIFSLPSVSGVQKL